LDEAIAAYRQAIALNPRFAEACCNLGSTLGDKGHFDEAIAACRQAIALKPGFAEAYCNLGSALREKSQLDEAIAAYHQAITFKPGFAEAYCNLGSALGDKGHFDEAIAVCRQAIVLKPNYPEAHYNLGNALREKSQLDEAIAAYHQVIALKPGFAEAHNNLGNALKDRGKLDEAIAAYHQAIALNPGLAEAYCNLGNALGDKGRFDEAIAACRQAIALKPNYPEAHNNLSVILKDKGQVDESLASLRQAIAIKSDYAKAHSNLLMTLHYATDHNASLIHEETLIWNRQHAEPLRQFIEPHPNDRNPDRRLRIGYVSSDFWAHASAFFLIPLLEHHDPRQVEVFGYAQVPRPDEVTSRLQKQITQWRNIAGLSDEQVAKQIRDDRIDILVDLKLHTGGNRLLIFARKPAPVQVTWLGYPGSTGLSTMDYRLSDPYLDPPGMDESVYSEQTIRLPHTFWCYDPMDGREIPVNSLPALATGIVTFGCLNNFCKVNDVVLRLWAKILNAVPSSCLLMLAPEGDHRQRNLELLKQEGVASQRVEFTSCRPRQQYLELYHHIDVGLDTFYCNGHTTSLDSFWMGVPVITLVGQTVVGRAGLSQLSNLGLPELAASTPEQYVKIAAALAIDLPRLTHLRSTLRDRMRASPLMDAAAFARDIESAYREIWRRWCAASRD
jgi:predicted O-linked N-acetylglucosamine transferase (SPINDLY family)